MILSERIWCAFFDSVTINSVGYVKHKQYTPLVLKLYDCSARFLRRSNLTQSRAFNFTEQFIFPQHRLSPLIQIIHKTHVHVDRGLR